MLFLRDVLDGHIPPHAAKREKPVMLTLRLSGRLSPLIGIPA